MAEMRELNPCYSHSIIVVCAANLTASDQCPHDCGKCFYGGAIAIHWSFKGQGYVQFYPNKTAIETEYEDLSPHYLTISEYDQAKLTALQDWLCTEGSDHP